MRPVPAGVLLALSAVPALAGPLPPVVRPWSAGALYTVVAAPGRVTDIVLEPGESLVGQGPVAAGDTARWILGHTESGTGARRQAHVLVKPVSAGLSTNLVINTDRRTYHLELRSTPADWSPLVSWRYPGDELIALRTPAAAPAPPAAPAAPEPPDLSRLNFAWRIDGRARFRPLRVFDDGRRTYVDLPPAVRAGELPPLFVLPDGGGAPQLANVRVQGTRLVADQVFARGELRLGTGRKAARVRLVREARP
jgi:type IV secretion system protein VirB9